MSSEGYDVICVQDGQDALALLETAQPDLILLDVDMPGLNGLELCSAIKKMDKFEHVPVLFQSVLSDSNVRVEGLRVGAADFLSKPYQPSEILLRVRIHLTLYALRTKLEQTVEQRTLELTSEIARRQQFETDLIASKTSLKALTSHLQEVREEERKRIAREIHDQLGQTLSLAQIELKRLSGILEGESNEVTDLLDRIHSSVATSSDIARSISENLRPGRLDVLGLKPALEYHIKTFEETTSLHCHTEIRLCDDQVLEDQYATAVFRIVQESLTNVAKHAQASEVTISIWGSEEGLMAIIQDDGIGVEATSNHQRATFGVLGMAERVEVLDGEFTIESLPGQGTRIEAFFPFGNSVEDD